MQAVSQVTSTESGSAGAAPGAALSEDLSATLEALGSELSLRYFFPLSFLLDTKCSLRSNTPDCSPALRKELLPYT